MIPVVWVVALIGAGALSGGAALGLALRAPVLERLHPRLRAQALGVAAFAPLASGLLVAGATLTPQGWLGLADHCLEGHGHLHLCLDCGLPAPPLAVWLFAAAVGLLALSRLGRSLVHVVRARGALGRLAGVARRDGDLSILPIPGPVAFVGGFLRPGVFVSSAARDPAWRAVLAHERDHARHRDPLARLAARLALSIAPPPLAAGVERQLVRAQELAADEAAALELGDRLEVAEQVLAWTRQARARAPLAALFEDGDVQERVQTLLRTPRYVHGPSPRQLAALALVATAFALALAPSIHHGVEELVHHLLLV